MDQQEADIRRRLEAQLLDGCEPLGDGLRVWSSDERGTLVIRGVIVEAQARGGWAFVRWIRRLPRDRRVVATRVTNPRLAEVFVRLGFRRAFRYDADEDEWTPVYVRQPLPSSVSAADRPPGAGESPP